MFYLHDGFQERNSGIKRDLPVLIFALSCNIYSSSFIHSRSVNWQSKDRTNKWWCWKPRVKHVRYGTSGKKPSSRKLHQDFCSYWFNGQTQMFQETKPERYLLTQWCRFLLEKLTGLHIVKKFLPFHGTRRFITALTSVRHLSLPFASSIQWTNL